MIKMIWLYMLRLFVVLSYGSHKNSSVMRLHDAINGYSWVRPGWH